MSSVRRDWYNLPGSPVLMIPSDFEAYPDLVKTGTLPSTVRGLRADHLKWELIEVTPHPRVLQEITIGACQSESNRSIYKLQQYP